MKAQIPRVHSLAVFAYGKSDMRHGNLPDHFLEYWMIRTALNKKTLVFIVTAITCDRDFNAFSKQILTNLNRHILESYMSLKDRSG